jgi:hypothetical protein
MRELGSINSKDALHHLDWRHWQGVDFESSGNRAADMMVLGAAVCATMITTLFFVPQIAAQYLPPGIRGVPSPWNIIFLTTGFAFCVFAARNLRRRQRSGMPILRIGFEGIEGFKRLGSEKRNAITWHDLQKVKFSHGAVLFFGYRDNLLSGRETITLTLDELGTDQGTLQDILKHFSRNQWPKR